MKRQFHFSFVVWAALLFLAVAPRPAQAQTGAIVGQADYPNLVYEGEPTNAPQTSLAETAAVDLFSGSISSLTNAPPAQAGAPAPTDGWIYLTASGVGQPVGGVPLAFYLPGMALLAPANGTVCTSPTNIPLNVQAWQLAFDEHVQTVAFYVTGANIGTNVLITTVTNVNSLQGTNSYPATWTNDLPGSFAITAVATDNLGGSMTSAPVHITVAPVILVNGQFNQAHGFTFLEGSGVTVTMNSPFAGYIRYTINGGNPLNPATSTQIYGGGSGISVVSSSFIQAAIFNYDGALIGEADPVNITVIPLYSLTVPPPGGGSITVSPSTGPYTSNALVTLTATPSNHWSFIGWAGDAVSGSSTLQLTMNSNISEQAVFGTTLSVQESGGPVPVSAGQGSYPQGGGSILVSPAPNQGLYPYGSSVLLTAVPSIGNYFQTWEFNLNSAGFNLGGSASPVNLGMVTTNPTVLALFSPLPTQTPPVFAFTVEIGSGDGAVAISPSYATFYTNGTPLSLTATPAAGQTFLGWSGAAAGSANPLSVAVFSNTIIIANFSVNLPPTVTITNPPGGATLQAPTNVVIGVTVADAFGTVTNVAFLTNGIEVGVVTHPPFILVLSNAAPAVYMLTAVATSTTGLQGASRPETVAVYPPQPVFSFDSAAYTVHESNATVTLTVDNYTGSPGSVNYQTVNGSAVGGNGLSGDYIASQGNLNFTGSTASLPLQIAILDNFINGPNLQFQVQLSGNVGDEATATVTIIRDDPDATTNALLEQVYPTNRPAMDGQLTVFTPPSGAGGQWRFPWEYAWRTNGQTAGSLVAGDYPVQFRKVPGYLAIPLTNDPIVTNGATTVVTNPYYPAPPAAKGALGSLTINITPTNLAGTGWQFFGETGWSNNGATASNLLPDTFLVQFEPVSGYATPPSLAVLVSNGMKVQLAGNYTPAPSAPLGVDTPQSLSTGDILDYPQLPYGFSGQLQTDVGVGSGAVVRKNVVLTAAHLVFNDNMLSYVSNAFWSFQEQAGVYQPEPQAARGWYVLSGYAAQRLTDILTNGYSADQSSPQSRDQDVAALYFLAAAARTGYGGYVSSDAVPNPYLTGSSFKTLVGYPVDGSMFGVVLTPGVMYATPLDPQPFFQTNDQVYAASWLFSYPGNSGGPLCVQYANGLYYPAAVYLGTLFDSGGQPSATVVRAIDNNVVNLMTLASDSGDTGTNNSGGGVITIIPSQGTSLNNPGYLILQLGPAAAVQAGAAWKLTNQPANYYSTANPSLQEITSTSALAVQFKPIPGWNLPTNRSVTVVPGVILTNVANYTVTNPLLTLDLVNGLRISGTSNTAYQIQSNSTLTGIWAPFKTNTLTNFGFDSITNHPRPGFYRAVWLTN